MVWILGAVNTKVVESCGQQSVTLSVLECALFRRTLLYHASQ